MTGEGAFDTSELREFGLDLSAVPVELARHAVPVLKKGAQNIKEDMQAEARKSKHFKGIEGAISYDVDTTPQGFVAEIGPDKQRVTAGKKGGPLGVIAYPGAPSGYYGSATGGATLEDPQKALEREIPNFEGFVGDFIDDVLDSL